MKIALYPGTFNPIHIGHLTVINYSIENFELDLLFIIPNKKPVHKRRKYFLDPEIRLKMILLSTENIIYKSKVKVSDFEIKSDHDSYTYLTVENFRNSYPNDELYLIIGTDSLIYYYWHNFDMIFKMIDYFIVIDNLNIGDIFDFMKRDLLRLHSQEKEHNKELLSMLLYFPQDIKEKFLVLKIPFISISSSLIWERLEQKKAIDYWVNEKVKHMLYKLVPLTGD